MDNIPAPVGPDQPFFYLFIDMIPDICPNYLRKLCLGKEENEEVFEQLTLELTSGNYNRFDTKLSVYDKNEIINKHKMFVSLFPEADPEYLYEQIKLHFRNPNKLDDFVLEMMENKGYPSKGDYIKKQEINDQEIKYVKKFNLKYFLGEIPNPKEHFENPNRNISYTDKDDYFYAVSLLQKKYFTLHIKEIIKVFDEQNCSVVKAAEILDTKHDTKNSDSSQNSLVKCKNLSLLQELAYVLNKEDILDFINIQNERKLRAVKIAETAGLVYTCECCYGENLTDYDLVGCPIGHTFCKECVKKSCEVIIGDGKIEFPCLADCGHQFRLNKLKDVLSPKLFAKIDQRKQIEEVKQAQIDDLVFCPFCDYVTTLPPNNNVLQCLNEDCGKETCKLCKQISHVPLRCEEVEKKETNMRTFIEERMTEALVRKCPKCNKCFLKESGCNKMTCSCGTLMCYVCKTEITGYQHFKSYGGKTCPLYSDINILHREGVINGAQRAKQELGNVQLKYDPSENI